MSVYLDHAATTPPNPASLRAFLKTSRRTWANPASIHAPGREAAKALEAARAEVAGALGAQPEEIILTSGGTEANNLALKAAAAAYGRRMKHIVTTSLEHPSVLETLKSLRDKGYEISQVQAGSDGALRAQAVLDACREDTFLVSVCAVCAETGAAQPLDALGRELKAKYPAALFHTDAVQAFLRMPLDPKTLRADLLSVSGHKIGAPKGIGALYVRRGLRLAPEIHGGGQEGGLRSGTSNAPLAAAFAAAVKNYVCVPDGLWLYAKESLQSVGARVLPLPDGARAPHILCFALESAALGRFLPGEVLVRMLSDKGVFISAGSACKRGKRGPALDGAALPPGMADGMVRASFSGETAKADIDALCEALRGL